MTPVIDCERQALEFESVPEYVQDAPLFTREAAVSMTSKIFNERQMPHEPSFEPEAPKSDELEALWPGVHHEFVHTPRRQPSFYLTIGFMAGAVISMLGVFGYTTVSQMVASKAPSDSNKILMAKVPQEAIKPSAKAEILRGQDGSETFLPASPVYQVQPGDTLAGIAFKNYKRVSPRLLDEICKANNMRNANVLNLGQKLNLPEYKTQSSQVAAVGRIQ